MTLKAVVNASPLILLGKINYLSLLNHLFDQVYIPSSVIREIQAVDDLEMNTALSRVSFEQMDVTNRVAVLGLLGRLHLGEVEVIIGAIENGISTVVLDENLARNKARQLGLDVTGTLGLLLKAEKHGLIDDIHQEIIKLRNAGMYLSDEIIQKIMSPQK